MANNLLSINDLSKKEILEIIEFAKNFFNDEGSFRRESLFPDKTIDKKFAGFEIQIEVKDKQELRQIMQKIRAMKITTSCKRNINEK